MYQEEELNKTAICILCRRIVPEWLDFLKTFTHYRNIYVMIDTNNFCDGSQKQNTATTEFVLNYSPKKWNSPTITIVYVSNAECIAEGYCNSSTSANMPPVIAWDRALYYFYKITYTKNIRYYNVWFIEEDVFFYSEDTLCKIDNLNRFPKHGLLCKIRDEGPVWSHYANVQEQLAKYNCREVSNGLVCICRVSSLLLAAIADYARINRQLCFIEALLPTLCRKYNMRLDSPKEFDGVFFDADSAAAAPPRQTPEQEDKLNLDVLRSPLRGRSKTEKNLTCDAGAGRFLIYHPKKSIEEHVQLRREYFL